MALLADIKAFFDRSSLNVLLLQKTLHDEKIPAETASRLAEDLLTEITRQGQPLNKEMLTDVFTRHGLTGLAKTVYNELKKDPICCPYGAICCP
jgi:hypothetical protein